MNYPTQLDEIDQWLFDSFGIVAGACSSTENLRYNTAKMVAEALWPKCKESLHIQETCKENGDSFADDIDNERDQVDKLEKAAADADIHLTYDEYMKCLDAAIEEYERRDKDVYCHETSFRWGFEAGANWQKEQLRDLCYQCEKNEETIYYNGMKHAVEQIKKEAVRGIVNKYGGRVWLNTEDELDRLLEHRFNNGDEVKIYIFKEK